MPLNNEVGVRTPCYSAEFDACCCCRTCPNHCSSGNHNAVAETILIRSLPCLGVQHFTPWTPFVTPDFFFSPLPLSFRVGWALSGCPSRIFRSFDRDLSGSVDYHEFCDFLLHGTVVGNRGNPSPKRQKSGLLPASSASYGRRMRHQRLRRGKGGGGSGGHHRRRNTNGQGSDGSDDSRFASSESWGSSSSGSDGDGYWNGYGELVYLMLKRCTTKSG